MSKYVKLTGGVIWVEADVVDDSQDTHNKGSEAVAACQLTASI